MRFTAVEFSPDAARISRLLRSRAEVRSSSFEADSHHSDELEFDLVIGNPPFGPRGLNALEGKPQWKNYVLDFADVALDRVRDGGLLVLLATERFGDFGSAALVSRPRAGSSQTAGPRAPHVRSVGRSSRHRSDC